MSDKNQTNRRNTPRFSVNLKVYEQGSRNILGYARDLSIQGLQLMSTEPLSMRQEIRLFLDPGDTRDTESRIELSAYGVWTSFTDTMPRLYYSGLHFIEPSEQTQDRILELLEALPA